MDFAPPDSLWTLNVGGESSDFCEVGIRLQDGSYLAGGSSASYRPGNFYDAMVIKADPNGELGWIKVYGGFFNDYCSDLVQLPNGNIILAGTTQSYRDSSANFWMLILNENGDSLSSTVFGGIGDEWCYVVHPVDNSELLLGGYISPARGDGDYTDMLLMKVNLNGDSLWSARSGSMYNDFAWAIEISDNNEIVVGGSSENIHHETCPAIVTLDGDGEIINECYFQNTPNSNIQFISPTDNGYIGIGNYNGSIWSVILNPDGEENDRVIYELENEFSMCRACRTFDSGYAVYGDFYNEEGHLSSTGLIRLTNDGRFAWHSNFGIPAHSLGDAVVQNDDFSFTLFGFSNTFENSDDVFILRTTPEINLLTDSSPSSNQVIAHGSIGSGNGRWGSAFLSTPEQSGFLEISEFEMSADQYFTVECWFLMNENEEHDGVLICKTYDEDSFSFLLSATSLEDAVIFEINTSDNLIHLEHPCHPANGEWHYLAATYNGEYARLFLDGQIEMERLIESEIVFDDSPLYIGSAGFLAREGQYYGSIDEVRVSNVLRENVNIDKPDLPLPDSANLLRVYPNPFNGMVNIEFILPSVEMVRIDVFDLSGCMVKQITNQPFQMGKNFLSWDSSHISSGIYIIRLKSEDHFESSILEIIR